jgi:adiponectin receptor
MKENINSGIINWKERFYNESAHLMESLDHVKVSDLLDDLSKRLNDFSEKIHQLVESDHPSKNIHHLSEMFQEQLISRWPVFVFLTSAIICLGCSAIFHWFSAHSEKTNDILARLDYAGISILVAGSCYPPYYFFFYCEQFLRTVYLAFISIFAASVFLYSFQKNFNKPQNRKFRGSLFLTLGISAAIPVIHLTFLGY